MHTNDHITLALLHVYHIMFPLACYYTQRGYTALICAVSGRFPTGKVKVVELLLSKGANIEATDKVKMLYPSIKLD
jgi:hypothetical protein